MSQMKETLTIQLFPGDILDELMRGEKVARYIVIGKEVRPTYQIEEEAYKRIIYNLYLIWCSEVYVTERYKPGALWTIDQEDLSFDVSDWDIVFKSPLSWRD